MEAGFENSLRLKNTAIMAVVGMRIYPARRCSHRR